MANEEQLRLLKEGGVEEWNAWREANPGVEVDLSGAQLRFAKLISANFSEANLSFSQFSFANLSKANLRFAKLNRTALQKAKFISANLSGANLQSASLRSANFRSVDLRGVNFLSADLRNTDFYGADLRFADLRGVNLRNTNLDAVVFHDTILDKVNLSNAIRLDKIKHEGPSTIGQNTLQTSQGQLPDIFLKGCGLSDWEIAASKLHNPNLTPKERTDLLYEIDRLQTEKPFQTRQVFISYTRTDERFIERIEQKFDERGIRYWRDIHDATAGRLDKIIDRAIEQNQIFLLVLSERSINSDWVEMEVTKARKMEKKLKREVICPVALDDSWKEADWSAELRTQIKKYNILDFSEWEDEAYFEQQYTKLLDGLNLFYLRG